MMDIFEFIDKSPSAFHAVDNVAKELEKDSFSHFSESENWMLFPGIKGYVTRNSSSLIAFRIPEKKIKGFHIYCAHTDSPCFRIKEHPEMPFAGKYIRLNTEKYGGMILSSWLDRPLSVAGRVVVDTPDGLITKLVNIDEDIAVIPNVAIHMNGDINKGYEYKPQNDMLPLICEAGFTGEFDKLIAANAGVKEEDILGRDLFLYSRTPATLTGIDKKFILAPRLDDLECVYAGMCAMTEAQSEEYITVFAIFDNEEVGSSTKQGADSTFLEDTLFRIAETLSYSRTDYLKLISDSFLISADNAHAAHPAMPSKADPVNKPFMNGGVVIKFNGNQRYATDAYSAAYLRKLCKENNIPVQDYANNSDIPGGSTLGNISTAHVSVPTVDIGLAQLAMHSACETAGYEDIDYLVRLVTAYMAK